MTSNVSEGQVAMARVKGFTLLELMIVVVIIAILAAIAIPAYGRYAFRAHRVDGQELLLRIANAQERFYATNNHYGALGGSGSTSLGFNDPAISEKGYYSVTSVVSSSSQAFVATATPIGTQADDACGELSIDNTGTKLPAATDTAHNTNGNCW